ncbi:MAG: hypothetical protein ACOYXT_13150 [Bacteroidota bacterium]
MNKILSILFFFFVTTSLFAQSSDATSTIQWNITQVNNINTQQVESVNETFTTSPQHIVWKDADGVVKFSFDVTGISGTWADVNQNGMIRFSFEFESQPAFVDVERAGGKLTIKINLYLNEPPQVYSLTAGSLTVL